MWAVEVEGVSHVYNPNSPFESLALQDITLKIPVGQLVGLIGPTGSGKSTFAQHLNGLLVPRHGRIRILGQDLGDKQARKEIRRRVGLVFQFPEQQLFEETVYREVAFGPKNLGIEGPELEAVVSDAIAAVGLDYEAIKDGSPFSLSGGQMRRVALAGVLAMNPEILILDEPTAGLDPRGRDSLLRHLAMLHRQRGLTMILISHDMDDIARLTERVIVMSAGRLVMDDTPRSLFSQSEELRRIGLDVPTVARLMHALRERGIDAPLDALEIDEAVEFAKGLLERGSPKC